MRIIIEIDGAQAAPTMPQGEVTAQTPGAATTATYATMPTETLRMAAALGALDAGPAPAAPMELAGAPPVPFPLSEPSAPMAAPGDLAAGAAPGAMPDMPAYETTQPGER